MISPPRFTLADLEAANDAWGCNCGPGALAAICGLTLDEVRPHFGSNWPGYTNPTAMFAALRSVGKLGARWTALRPGFSGAPLPWPGWGLCRIQWEGPWTKPGVPMRARYRYTHWVGAARRSPAVSIKPDRCGGEVGIFDVNALANGSGWCSLEDWSTHIAPELAKGHDRRATGGWHITHAIEVAR